MQSPRVLSEVATANTALLDAYFGRTGYAGPTHPTLDVLHGIVGLHTAAIPFENLDVLLGRAIDLSLDGLVRKLVHGQRGGYCFEQNGLLLEVLTALGFAARPLSARVRYQRPRDLVTPRAHVFLRVELDGEPWMVDVGFGGFALTSAIRLLPAGEQATPHEPRRILAEDGRYYHQVRLGDDWHDLAEFTLEEMPLIDRELANWYTSTHPQSAFRLRLVAARALPDGRRVTMLNRELTRRGPGGAAEVTTIETPEALLDVLADDFGLEFPRGTVFPCEGLDWAT